VGKTTQEKIAEVEGRLGATAAESFREMDDDRLRLEIDAVEMFLERVEHEKRGDGPYARTRQRYVLACEQRREIGTPVPRDLVRDFLDRRYPYTEREYVACQRRRLAQLHLEARGMR
jgi:hypothetical protein